MKNWIQQLSESYIHQALNEMALTQQGLRDVQQIGKEMQYSFQKEDPIRQHLSKYHELLRTHPTKIFDGEGNHIGNILHVDLNGQPMAGPSAEEVQSHDDSLHYYAWKADQAISDHETRTLRRIPGRRELGLTVYPHPDHVRQGRSRGAGPHGPADERLSGLYPGPIT